MAVLNIQQGGTREPIRMVLYGANGIGKTTFGAGMPKPFVLAVEDGIGKIPVSHDKAHAKDYDTIIQTLMEVGAYFQRGEFKTLVVDSMDALQKKIMDKILREHGKKTLSDFSYGKGYELFRQEWEGYRDLMERFHVELNAHVLLTAQGEVRPIADPVNGSHDTYSMRIDKRAVGVLRDWADLVGYAQLRADPVRDKEGNITRLITTGERILSTSPSAAFDAKNRFDLPEKLPLAWVSLDQALDASFQQQYDPHRFAQQRNNAWPTQQPGALRAESLAGGSPAGGSLAGGNPAQRSASTGGGSWPTAQPQPAAPVQQAAHAYPGFGGPK
ncbi:ATP-binding protein [Acidithiobacillus thiooxidans]|uniref:ATP-binding protein n=1 Tax=Acidithiobacillus thiooxidans TaxID=930 RepID=UPI00286644D5|nr:ATP-binding protein [Acidithiobacillus thiooxidans]MDR7927209.1 ATP-binding protein [Acidithiobacillus thiooxidans]